MNNNIKIGGVTIIYKPNIINYFIRSYLSREISLSNETNIIVLFNENNQLYELKNLPIENYTVYDKSNQKKIPNYIKINKTGIYKRNKPQEDSITFANIYEVKYKRLKYEYSQYNSVFYIYDKSYNHNERIVFSLFKITDDSTDSCKFIFSYDVTKFTEIQVCNIIRMILTSL